MTDPRDEALQRSCPVLAAPLFGVLPTMENGQRVIVASNGVFVQVKRDWLDCVERLGGIDVAMPLPYGRITPIVRFTFGTIPIALLDAFIAAGVLRFHPCWPICTCAASYWGGRNGGSTDGSVVPHYPTRSRAA